MYCETSSPRIAISGKLILASLGSNPSHWYSEGNAVEDRADLAGEHACPIAKIISTMEALKSKIEPLILN